MSDDTLLEDAVVAVEQALIGHGYSAHSVIVLAEVTTPDMDSQMLAVPSRGLKQWQSMGLLEYAKALELKGVLSDKGDDE